MNTTSGNLIEDGSDTAKIAGIDLSIPLSEAQERVAKSYGLDLDDTRMLWNAKDIDSHRISKTEMIARGEKGESAILALKDNGGKELTNAQASMAFKLNVDPILARRAMNLNEQEFVPKAEKEAELIKKGKWNDQR